MSVFNPNEHCFGGAMVIQSHSSGLKKYVNQIKSISSPYSEANNLPPPRRPSPSRYLTTDFRHLRNKYHIRKDLREMESRIANETPISFTYSLKNRKQEEAEKKKWQEQQRFLRALKKQEIQKQKLLLRGGGVENLGVAAAASGGGGETTSSLMAALTNEEESMKLAMHAAKRPESARHRKERMTRASEEKMSSRAGWDPSTQLCPAEVHGLKTLLAETDREILQEEAVMKKNVAAAAAAAAAKNNKRGMLVSSNMKLNDSQVYSGEGISSFVPQSDDEMRFMLLDEFDRASPQQQIRRPASAASASSNNNNTRRNFSSSSSSSARGHPENGFLIREAARKILTRIDNMGDRVNPLLRQSIANSASHILPVRSFHHQDEEESMREVMNQQELAMKELRQLDEEIKKQKEFQKQQRLQEKEQQQEEQEDNNDAEEKEEGDTSNNKEENKESKKEKKNAGEENSDNSNEGETAASSLQKEATSEYTITKESPSPLGKNSSSSSSSSPTQGGTFSRTTKTAAIEYSEEQEQDGENQTQHQQASSSARKSSVTFIPKPPSSTSSNNSSSNNTSASGSRRASSGLHIEPSKLPSSMPVEPLEEEDEEDCEGEIKIKDRQTELKVNAPKNFVL